MRVRGIEMRYFLPTLFIITSLACLGQSSLGLKGGINFSKLGGDVQDADFKLGPNFGLFASRSINDNLALRTELFFSHQGANIGEAKANYSYINLPVLLQIQMTSGQFFIGPQAGLLINGRLKEDGDKENITASLNNLDVSGVIGVMFPASEKIWYDFRFSYGLISTDNTSNEDLNIANIVLSASINYVLK